MAVNLKVTPAVNSASKLEGESGSKLEGVLLLDTRCHCMNTSSENIKSLSVWPLDVTCRGVDLKVTDSGSGIKLEGDSGSKHEGDSGSSSKLEGALLLVNMQSEILN